MRQATESLRRSGRRSRRVNWKEWEIEFEIGRKREDKNQHAERSGKARERMGCEGKELEKGRDVERTGPGCGQEHGQQNSLS